MAEAKWLTSKEADEIKKKYPIGTKIKLIKMDDPYHPIPGGTIGTVRYIDSQGQLFMDWENCSSSLPIVVDIDQFEVLNEKKEEKEGAAAC